MIKKGLKVLIVYYNPNPIEQTRMTILDHLKTLESSNEENDISYFNIAENFLYFQVNYEDKENTRDKLLAESFDAVIFHNTFFSVRTVGISFFRWKNKLTWMRNLKGVKIAIPQDEADFATILDEWMLELNISIIFSVHYKNNSVLYPKMRKYATIINCLPGYINESIAINYQQKIEPIKSRQYDIVYRAQKLSYRFGRAGYYKHFISEVVSEKAKSVGLKFDISTAENSQIKGCNWLDFIASSKAVIGTEGGYTSIDWVGELRSQTNRILRSNPNITFTEFSEKMPKGWDDYDFTTITPRHFEAVITKTAQFLLEGKYKNILIPNRHYVKINRDLSNLDEVLNRIKDINYLQNMVDLTYEEIYLSRNHTYAVFAQTIEDSIMEQKKQEAESLSQFIPINYLKEIEQKSIEERHYNIMIYESLANSIKDDIFSVVKNQFKDWIKNKPLLIGLAFMLILLFFVDQIFILLMLIKINLS